MDQDCPVPRQPAHEDTKLKEHIVPEGYVPPSPALDDVIGVSDRDCKIRLVHRLFKGFERISASKENALAPDCAKHVPLQLRLYLACHFKRLSGRDDEKLGIFVR